MVLKKKKRLMVNSVMAACWPPAAPPPCVPLLFPVRDHLNCTALGYQCQSGQDTAKTWYPLGYI